MARLRRIPETAHGDALQAVLMGCLFAVLMAASTLVWSTGIGGWAGYAGAGVFYAVWMFGVLRWRHWRSARPRTPTA